MNDFVNWQQNAQAHTEAVLQRLLPESTFAPQTLHQAMRYAALDGGKRLRPMLVLAAAELGDCVQAACEAALAAVECIHVYSLVHDDMPEMDNDTLRRGKPTCHVAFGAATALLVGDALQTLAFDALSRETILPAARQLRMLNALGRLRGGWGWQAGRPMDWQAVEWASVGRDLPQDQLEQMHSLKTGALIRAAVQLGGLSCPDVDDEALAALDVYAAKLGLAFQVIDDVLDCEADTATLGKTAGKDADADKPTYVKLLGLDAAREYAAQLINEAVAALAPFGERATRLRELAEFTIGRTF